MNPDLPDLIDLPSGVSKPPAKCSRLELEWAVEHRFAIWLMLNRPQVRAGMAESDEEIDQQAESSLREAKALAEFAGLEMPRVLKLDSE